jgi:putative ABC transport system substrate-binding protein
MRLRKKGNLHFRLECAIFELRTRLSTIETRMRRRDFIAFLGAATAAYPLAVSAQAPAMPLIGFLNSTSRGPAEPLLAAFHRALNKAGYVEGQNVAIEYRWAEGQYDRLPALAADLVRRKVAVIAATGGLLPATVAKAATSTIPVLFIAGFDPVHEGLVASINRPGGNATGVSIYTAELGRKRLELLRELVPGITKIAMLVNPGSISTATERKDLEGATRDVGLQLLVLEARDDSDFEKVFGAAADHHASALMVTADAFLTSRRAQIVAIAARHALPASYPWPQYVEAGGLMSYGPNLIWAYEQMGLYASRILKGAKPYDLPVQLPTKFELDINLKTARALGLAVSPFLLARADQVIE